MNFEKNVSEVQQYFGKSKNQLTKNGIGRKLGRQKYQSYDIPDASLPFWRTDIIEQKCIKQRSSWPNDNALAVAHRRILRLDTPIGGRSDQRLVVSTGHEPLTRTTQACWPANREREEKCQQGNQRWFDEMKRIECVLLEFGNNFYLFLSKSATFFIAAWKIVKL